MKRKNPAKDAISEKSLTAIDGADVQDGYAEEYGRVSDNSLRSEENKISSQYLKYLKKYPLLTKGQEYDLAIKAGEGDKEARDLMIKSNLGLVISVAKKYHFRGYKRQRLRSRARRIYFRYPYSLRYD